MEVYYLALEFLSMGDLFLYLSRTGSFSETIWRYLFHQLIEGLECIHENGIYHRDIKPENLMFDEDFTLKIADFGFATNQPISNSCTGTSGYMLPEIYKKVKYSSQSADLFAAGVVLFNMLTQYPPFETATPSDYFYKMLWSNSKEAFWKAHCKKFTISDDFKTMVSAMLSPNPSDRLSIAEIKESEWYNGELPSFESYRTEMEYRRDMIIHFSNIQENPIDASCQK
jgi:5'-AMP-activated protein kinase, catalytic alpha subunit